MRRLLWVVFGIVILFGSGSSGTLIKTAMADGLYQLGKFCNVDHNTGFETVGLQFVENQWRPTNIDRSLEVLQFSLRHYRADGVIETLLDHQTIDESTTNPGAAQFSVCLRPSRNYEIVVHSFIPPTLRNSVARSVGGAIICGRYNVRLDEPLTVSARMITQCSGTQSSEIAEHLPGTAARLEGIALLDMDATPSPTPVPTGTPAPTKRPKPSHAPTPLPTSIPTSIPTSYPTAVPTPPPTSIPTSIPTSYPSSAPTSIPTATPTFGCDPTPPPTLQPSPQPTSQPSVPTELPTSHPSRPSWAPTAQPSPHPSLVPSLTPSAEPPSAEPTAEPSNPSATPTGAPTIAPTHNGTLGSPGSSANPHSSSDAFMETDTGIGTVAGAGAVGLGAAAAVAYYLLKASQNLVRVPLAPANLANIV